MQNDFIFFKQRIINLFNCIIRDKIELQMNNKTRVKAHNICEDMFKIFKSDGNIERYFKNNTHVFPNGFENLLQIQAALNYQTIVQQSEFKQILLDRCMSLLKSIQYNDKILKRYFDHYQSGLREAKRNSENELQKLKNEAAAHLHKKESNQDIQAILKRFNAAKNLQEFNDQVLGIHLKIVHLIKDREDLYKRLYDLKITLQKQDITIQDLDYDTGACIEKFCINIKDVYKNEHCKTIDNQRLNRSRTFSQLTNAQIDDIKQQMNSFTF